MVTTSIMAALFGEGDDEAVEADALTLLSGPARSLGFNTRLDLEALTYKAFVFLFRFDRRSVEVIVDMLPLPTAIRLPNGSVFTRIEAFCVMLHRFAYPGRYGDLQDLFRRQRSEISITFNFMVRFMYNNFMAVLSVSQASLPLEKLREFATAVSRKGSPLLHCVVFIDGTVRAIARPTKNQRDFYNGHKRNHAVKYQGVVTPDGMFADVYGPILGRRHNMYLFSKSKILNRLDTALVYPEETFYVYGDPAYVLRPTIQVGFKGARLTQNQADFNTAMSSKRVTAEWAFGIVVNLWAFLDVKRSQKIWMSPVGMYYPVAMLLSNMLNCTCPSQVSQFFQVQPLSLAD